jgi:UDP-N-acetylmuramyl pentapeptide phosphotransferase/UDP-N-acetylglucosamine-1-phosphate transferase
VTLTIALSAAIAFVASIILTRLFCRPGSRFYLLDHPNERSLHTRPTPRSGGVAITVALGLSLLATAPLTTEGLWHAFAVQVLAALSFVDDRRGLPVSVRLFGHIAVAAILVGGIAAPHPVELWPGLILRLPEWLVWGGFVVFVAGMINIYNFMDGMDGFAGGMALIGFGTLALLGMQTGHFHFTVVCVATAAAAAGFLISNFPPARIFMGDTGSAVLGLLAGVLVLWGSRDGIFPFWAGLLVFSPFVVDACVTLARRLVAGEQVWKAHKTHYYQRLVQSGWGHRKTVLAEYGLMLACAVSALMVPKLTVTAQAGVAAGWCITYVLLMLGAERLIRDKSGK